MKRRTWLSCMIGLLVGPVLESWGARAAMMCWRFMSSQTYVEVDVDGAKMLFLAGRGASDWSTASVWVNGRRASVSRIVELPAVRSFIDLAR